MRAKCHWKGSGFLPWSALLMILTAACLPANAAELCWQKLAAGASDSSTPLNISPHGAFAGISNGRVIIAGGAIASGDDIALQSDVWILDRGHWHKGMPLEKSVAYGASVSADVGLICLGGWNGHHALDEVFILTWDAQKGDVEKSRLPRLPRPCKNGAAAIVDNALYFAAERGAERTVLWRMNLGYPDSAWQDIHLPPYITHPAFAAAQHNGENDCLYLFCKNATSGITETWQFNPAIFAQNPLASDFAFWQKLSETRLANIACVTPFGQGFLFAFGYSSMQPHSAIFHTITNTWVDNGPMPFSPSEMCLLQGDQILVRASDGPSSDFWRATVKKNVKPFGVINFIVLILYLSVMAAVGLFFLRRNKNTEDYFRGGQKIPWWLAGCSIFATMLSSITYMALPSKAFAADWTYLLGFPIILLISLFVIYQILPFFRRINATSAYEYLELRFNLTTRLLGSGLFILFHIGRMAIVMYLSALALAAITPLTDVQAILIMGLLSLLYSTLGGIEAVLWTDTLQTFVLFGGAILILIFAIIRIDGGLTEMIRVATEAGKFKVIHWDWSRTSYTITAFWVIVLGGIGQNLVSYTSDQAVVQRYMTTPDEKTAARAILTNGLLSQPVGLLFLSLGAALYVFYKMHPSHLDPTFKIDAVMPMFIARELPVGVAGLIVAGIFAAAQSTVSTSMNSTATAFVTDFLRRFNLLQTERGYFNAARLATLAFGSTGVALAILFAGANITSMLDSFFSLIGLFGGALAGLFLLGIYSRRANGTGALIGAICGGAVLWLVQSRTNTHVYLYALIGILVSVAIGYGVSLLTGGTKKALHGLTVHNKGM